VKRGERNVDGAGVAMLEGQRRAALGAKAAHGVGRAFEMCRLAARPMKLCLGHGRPGDRRRAMGLLAHAAMADLGVFEHLGLIADSPALAAAREGVPVRGHVSLPVGCHWEVSWSGCWWLE